MGKRKSVKKGADSAAKPSEKIVDKVEESLEKKVEKAQREVVDLSEKANTPVKDTKTEVKKETKEEEKKSEAVKTETFQQPVKAAQKLNVESPMDTPKEQAKASEETKKVEKTENADDIVGDFADFADMLGDDSDEPKPQPKKVEKKPEPKKDEKKPEPKKDDVKPLAESEFEKVDVSPVKDTPKKPIIVNENHIQESSDKKRPEFSGIKAFTHGEAGEIDSPMRKKKRNLGQLNTVIDIKKTEPKNYDKLEKDFKQVMANFTEYQKEFEKMKAMNKDERLVLRNSKKLQKIEEQWQRSLEMNLHESDQDDSDHENDLVEFNQLKNAELKEIEHFLQILKEWVHDVLSEFESEPYPKKESTKKVPTLSKQSSQMLVNAQIQQQAKLQAQMSAERLAQSQRQKQQQAHKEQEDEENSKLMSQLDSLQEDEDLMAGLEQLDKKEKADIKAKKELPEASPRVPQEKSTQDKPKTVEKVVEKPKVVEKIPLVPRVSKDPSDGKEQGQGSGIVQKPKEEEDPNKSSDSQWGIIGVVAALAILGVGLAVRASQKK